MTGKLLEQAGKTAVTLIIGAAFGILLDKLYKEHFDKAYKEEIRLKKAKADFMQELVKRAKNGEDLNVTKMV